MTNNVYLIAGIIIGFVLLFLAVIFVKLHCFRCGGTKVLGWVGEVSDMGQVWYCPNPDCEE